MCILLAESQVWTRGGQAYRPSQHSPLALIPFTVDLQYHQSFKQQLKTAHDYRKVQKKKMDFFLAVWPRRTPAVKRAQEMGKFQLDTDQESRGPVFTTTGALVLTPVELEESVWYYGTDYVNPAAGQADRFTQSKTAVLNVISSEGEPLWWRRN